MKNFRIPSDVSPRKRTLGFPPLRMIGVSDKSNAVDGHTHITFVPHQRYCLSRLFHLDVKNFSMRKNRAPAAFTLLLSTVFLLVAYATRQNCGASVSANKFVALPQQAVLAPVKSGNKYGYVDSTGRYVIHPRFEAAFPFQDGLALVKLGGQWTYIDKTGEFVVIPQLD